MGYSDHGIYAMKMNKPPSWISMNNKILSDKPKIQNSFIYF